MGLLKATAKAAKKLAKSKDKAALPVAAGLLAAGQSDDADAGFITKGGKTLLEAWHGSPHKFDKFSMDQIGTGEGAQAYGHGLYFADSEDVATGYRNRLSGNSASMYGDLDIKWNGQEVPEAHREAVSYLNDPLVMGEAKTNDAAGLAGVLENIPGYEDSARWLRDNSDKITATPSGHLYRTEIDVTPESLLDWDKPLSEQSGGVRRALDAGQWDNKAIIGHWMDKSLENPSYDGNDLYQRLSGTLGSRQEASSYLSDRGIKGIKYLDGDSRHPTQAEADIANEIRELEKRRELAGFMSGTPDVPDLSDSIKSLDGDIASRRQALKEMEGARQTSNYVIFDDSLINIAERGNADPRLLAGIAGTTAAGLAAPMIKDSGMISAPRSEGLMSFTMGARDLERRLAGSPASLLFPEGVINYLETANRRTEDPNAMTRAMALLDFF